MTTFLNQQISFGINLKLRILFFLTYFGNRFMFSCFRDNIDNKRNSNATASFTVL
jgi:hypothetical protein